MALPAIAGLLVAAPSSACWDKAAARYGLSSHLLYALARTESGLNPAAVDRNCDGSRDIGLMQINSSWLPTLAGHRIAEHHLFDACTSIHVARLGYTWDAVGAYNARSAPRRRAYSHRVHRDLMAATAASARRTASNDSPERLASDTPPGLERGSPRAVRAREPSTPTPNLTALETPLNPYVTAAAQQFETRVGRQPYGQPA
jgi:hypothetical protein